MKIEVVERKMSVLKDLSLKVGENGNEEEKKQKIELSGIQGGPEAGSYTSGLADCRSLCPVMVFHGGLDMVLGGLADRRALLARFRAIFWPF